jgi:hypothetical protein
MLVYQRVTPLTNDLDRPYTINLLVGGSRNISEIFGS